MPSNPDLNSQPRRTNRAPQVNQQLPVASAEMPLQTDPVEDAPAASVAGGAPAPPPGWAQRSGRRSWWPHWRCPRCCRGP